MVGKSESALPPLKQYRLLIAFAIMLASSLVLLGTIDREMHDDVRVYRASFNNLLSGSLPYRDHIVEYPPYAIPIFILPRVLLPASFGDEEYRTGFLAITLLSDWTMKLLLLFMFIRCANALKSLLPVSFYSAAACFEGHYFLQRYDIFPALICVCAIWLLCSGRFFLCGAAIAVGIGVKLYPAVLVPPLFILAVHKKEGARFVAGLTVGLLPIALLSFVVPWWHFAQFQGARGLQAESLYATVLWLGKLCGVMNVVTAPVFSSGAAGGWREVQGNLASILLPWIRGLFVVVMGVSTLASCWAAARCENLSATKLARILLLPLLGFVAFNQILSPQFMIWLAPLAAIGSLDKPRWAMFGILAATLITPVVFFPFYQHDYYGFDALQTVFLVFRNVTLVIVWMMLLREMFLPGRTLGNQSTESRFGSTSSTACLLQSPAKSI